MNGRTDTEPRRRGFAAAACVAALALTSAGCATREAITRDVEVTCRADAAREIPREPAVTVEGRLTLEDALKLALAHNKDLQAIRKESAIAAGRVLESYSAALPRLSADAGYTRLDEVSSFNVGGQDISLGFTDNYSAGLTVRQPLYRGGAISATLRSAQLSAVLSDESIRAAVEGLVFQTAKDYFDVLLARHLVAVEEQAVKTAEAHLEDVKRKRRSGVASDYDVLRSEVEVSNFRAELIRQRNALNLGLTRLLKTMGVSQQARVTPADELTYRPMKPVLDEAMRIARANRSDIYQAELSVRLQREALRIARSAYWPQVDAFLTQKWANPDPHSSTSDEWGDAWTAGATLSLAIFDGFARRGKVAQEKARLEQAEIKRLNARETVALEVRQAVLNLEDAEELVESQAMNLQRAEEALRLVQAGYREGVNTEVEVTDANTALTRTRALYYQAIHAHVLARTNFQRTLGMLWPRAGDFPAKPGNTRPGGMPDFGGVTGVTNEAAGAAPMGEKNINQGATR